MSSDPVLAVLAAAPPGTVRWPAALRVAGGFDALASASRSDCVALGLGADAHAQLVSPRPAMLRLWRDWLQGPDRHLIGLDTDRYPARLAELRAAPLALWADGTGPGLLHEPSLAIVGSRHGSAGGLALARVFAGRLAAAGVTVASGLAAGIDAAAHDGAVETLGSTIAVLGCGIDRVYPRRNAGLAARIRAHGVIVSEYPPGTPPRAHRFPERNRLIAGLTLGTLVVEAAARSGSLITARLAGEFGREVFAVPGSVHSALSRGCHRLLREGACLVENVDDILTEIAPALAAALPDELPAAPSADPAAALPGAEKLLNRLDFSPVSIAELAADTGLTTKELSSMLLHLEMQGTVEALPSGRYCRLNKRTR